MHPCLKAIALQLKDSNASCCPAHCQPQTARCLSERRQLGTLNRFQSKLPKMLQATCSVNGKWSVRAAHAAHKQQGGGMSLGRTREGQTVRSFAPRVACCPTAVPSFSPLPSCCSPAGCPLARGVEIDFCGHEHPGSTACVRVLRFFHGVYRVPSINQFIWSASWARAIMRRIFCTN